VDILVSPAGRGRGTLLWGAATYRCALGRGGIRADKREGDGATPAGSLPLRRLIYRADRLERPETVLAAAPMAPADGWCDDPADSEYNRQVRLPYPGRAEALWREDGIYDLVVVLGWNDDPVVPGRGSAIFLHVARPDYAPTQGCVALALGDLMGLLEEVAHDTRLCVGAAEGAP
jgi:L,D-peptidoglycan transpeptidase YkuD (ErfK/YbiS/YcfS/YnhG family)